MKDNNFTISPNYVIFCDDVRREDNGKLLFVGVYSGDAIVVASFPANLNMTFYVEFEMIGTGEAFCEYRAVLFPDNSTVAKMAAKFGITEGKEKALGSFSFSLETPMQIHKDGYISFQYKIGDSEWKELSRRNIISHSSIGAEQPSEQ
jgi:uncharacterized protein DUF6941